MQKRRGFKSHSRLREALDFPGLHRFGHQPIFCANSTMIPAGPRT
jgi:hypothetical protein